MRYEIRFDGQIVSGSKTPLTSDDVEAFVDSAVEELEKINAEDIDVSTDLSKHVLTVSVTVEAADLLTAQGEGNSTIRTAFHAAGVGTPGWSIDWTYAQTVPESDSHPYLDGELTPA
jgi:hypothetical protein